MQPLGASYMQLGTTSAHQLLFLTNGTGRWAINSSGHFIVDSGSLTIGFAAGNRPTIVYASTSLNAGTPGVSGVAGVWQFNEQQHADVQSGVTSSSITYTCRQRTAQAATSENQRQRRTIFQRVCIVGASLTASQVGVR